MGKRSQKSLSLEKRHRRLRQKVHGTKEVPRLSVHRSNLNLYTQLIDDVNEVTLLSVSTRDDKFKKLTARGGNVKEAELLGQVLAKEAKAKGINRVVFDRGGYLYHGRVKALAEACRKHGLEF